MRAILILVALCLSLSVFSQDYKFKKVSKEELKETFYPKDSSATASYLYKHRRTFYVYQQEQGFSLVTEVHERIKIYKKEGFNYATKAISLYKGASGVGIELSGLKAYTYNIVNGGVKETKLKKEGVFKTELSKNYDQIKFTMPNIKEGAVIEYKYEIRSPFYSTVDEFKFQHDIPIKKLHTSFEAPEFFNFKLKTKGFLTVIPVKEKKHDKITLVNKVKSGDYVAATTYSSNDIDFVNHITSYNLDNIPALKVEPYVNNISNYRSGAKYELSYVKYPDEIPKYYTTTWEDVVKTIYKNSNFGPELQKTGYFEKDIDALINGVLDPIKKAALIFKYVKSKVKWNKHYGKYTSVGVRKAYKTHTGNVAEINLMLTAMLRYAGLNANPVLVSTRSNGIPLFPTREGYNYVISAIESPNGVVLLDATIANSMPNVLPFKVLNWKGRVIRKSGSSAMVSLYPKKKSKTTTTFMANLLDNGSLQGFMRTAQTGHKAMRYRAKFNSKSEDKFIENLENKYNGIEIDEFNVKNNKKASKAVIETMKFSMEDQADIINNKMYFSPFFFLKTKENPFKLNTRAFPVDFGYPNSLSYRFTISLPEGYKVAFLPESKAFQLPDKLGMFSYKIALLNNKIQLVVSSAINKAIITPIYYKALKAYFKSLIEKENEQIVLTKV